MKCPKCATECEREEVDVGPGNVYGPWQCRRCGWNQQDEVDAMLGEPCPYAQAEWFCQLRKGHSGGHVGGE